MLHWFAAATSCWKSARERRQTQERVGTLFHATCDEMRQTSFTAALAVLLKLLEQMLKDIVGFSKEQVDHLMQRSLSNYHQFLEDNYYF